MLHLTEVDSTNNYAMRLIDAAAAEHGTAILADVQTVGKGQRGKGWSAGAGESVLMSLIVAPQRELWDQGTFLASVANSMALFVQNLLPHIKVAIKWPNDIMVSDKKAAGILIENTIRGTAWQWAVVGIGLNVNQDAFGEKLPYATSLRMISGEKYDVRRLAADLYERLLKDLTTANALPREDIWQTYNSRLYKAGEQNSFRIGETIVSGTVIAVHEPGHLEISLPEKFGQRRARLTHGEDVWIW